MRDEPLPACLESGPRCPLEALTGLKYRLGDPQTLALLKTLG
jgi:hypothetical protein